MQVTLKRKKLQLTRNLRLKFGIETFIKRKEWIWMFKWISKLDWLWSKILNRKFLIDNKEFKNWKLNSRRAMLIWLTSKLTINRKTRELRSWNNKLLNLLKKERDLRRKQMQKDLGLRKKWEIDQNLRLNTFLQKVIEQMK